MEVYKVLIRDSSGLSSVSQHHPHTFEPGQITVSTDAPLFVFTNLGYAKSWSQYRFFSEVWQVEVDYLWDISRIIHNMDPGLVNPDVVRAWWRNEIELKTQPVSLYTKITPAVRLIKPLETAIVRLGQAEREGHVAMALNSQGSVNGKPTDSKPVTGGSNPSPCA